MSRPQSPPRVGRGSTPLSRTVELEYLLPFLHLQSSPLPRIVTPFDVIKDIGSRLSSAAVVLSVHPFPFQHTKESLRGGIVGTPSQHAHATDHTVRLQKQLTAPNTLAGSRVRLHRWNSLSKTLVKYRTAVESTTNVGEFQSIAVMGLQAQLRLKMINPSAFKNPMAQDGAIRKTAGWEEESDPRKRD